MQRLRRTFVNRNVTVPARGCYIGPVCWGHDHPGRMELTIAVIVCAYNEARLLPGCLYSLRVQTRPADQILVVNNASTDGTRAAAEAVPDVTVLDEPVKGLVSGRRCFAARRNGVPLPVRCAPTWTWRSRCTATDPGQVDRRPPFGEG